MPLIEIEKFTVNTAYDSTMNQSFLETENRHQSHLKSRKEIFKNLNIISSLGVMILFVFTLQHCDMKKHCFNSSEADFTLILGFTLGLTYVIHKTLKSMKAKSLGQVNFEPTLV